MTDPSTAFEGYKFGDAERVFYTRLFESLQRGGVVGGDSAATVMRRSNLSDDLLGKIWDLSDRSMKGHLTMIEFYVAMRGIALAQKQQHLSKDDIAMCGGLDLGDLPRLGPDFPLPSVQEVAAAAQHIHEPLANATFSTTINPQFHVKLSLPIKHESGFAEHMKYAIEVHCTTGVLNSTESVVHRRYSDFEWLRFRILEDSMGRVVPPLPIKKYFGRFEKEFLDDRREGLELFLNRLASDPVFMNARPLATFLQADEAAFSKAKSTGPSLIDQVIMALQSSLRLLLPHNVTHNLPTDAKLEDFSNKLKELKIRLKAVKKSHNSYLQSLTVRMVGVVELVDVMLPPVVVLSKSEIAESTGLFLKQFEAAKERQKKEFQDVIALMISQIRAVQEVIQQRCDSHAKYNELQDKVESKKVKQAAMRGDATKSAALHEIDREISSLSKESDSARHRFDTISRELEREIVQFDTMRQQHTIKALKSVVELEATFAKESAKWWQGLLSRILEANKSGIPTLIDVPPSFLKPAPMRNVSRNELKHIPTSVLFEVGAECPQTISRKQDTPTAQPQRVAVETSFGRSRSEAAHDSSGVVVLRTDLPAYAQAIATSDFQQMSRPRSHVLDDDPEYDDFVFTSKPKPTSAVPTHWE
eukprot:c9750_g1_i1.p1 GENE.c9750_g1_i1~~c9750_g1_i1.p1  ORF type:complete len:659 (-),score=189.07 c9750_g1_i1:139-2070(-)